ncbi:MAG: glycosyltransferase family 2 protein [Acidobacteria bacterium]|nr:glycosyltransferase family 2 protein [Acidobacteriota bacterium]
MLLIFYFFAAVQVFFGYKSLRGGIEFFNYFKKELSDKKEEFSPFATIIVPCRGIEVCLEENLLSLFKQDYSKFEIIFVVDNESDESLPLIRSLISKNDIARLIIAGKATNSGQKVHNLIEAAGQIADESEVLVFVDSDARPDKYWLKNLVAPLIDPAIGCTTGYRWFIQIHGGLATQLRAVWNASIASALGQNSKSNFCWGGSMAIRRDNFDSLEIRNKWRGTLSDDFALTKVLHEAGKPICFVPQCLTASVGDCGPGELLEFTTRQMKITRVYSPSHWIVSLISAFLFTAVFFGGIAHLFFTRGIYFWIDLSLIVILFILGGAKAWIRLLSVKMVLPDYEIELNKQLRSQLTLWVITPIIFLFNDLMALISRRIVWRGIEYELKSATETVIIGRIEKG